MGITRVIQGKMGKPYETLVLLSQVTGKDILKMMKTWTNQMGHPLINITRDPINVTRATATQQHFLIDPKAKVTVKSPYE